MIHFVPETGSTNTDLLERLRAGELMPEGDWLVADRQTQGRGRHGRDWFDRTGNFMGSTLVHQQAGDPAAETLALVGGMALYEAVASHCPGNAQLMLKWPNDLLAGDAKVAGILLERAGDTVVAGIGVNLVSAPDVPGREVAALSDLGTPPDRDVFAADLARSFAAELERWRNGGIAPLARRWQKAAHPLGTNLSVQEVGRLAVSGSFAGLTQGGALQLRLADGSMRAIQAGEVLLDRDGDE
ncbi:MAG: biotin--[acetyl-CoA-carboxylase] ligase [Sphingomonadaceae bacterium]|nr:biotin--[acetyl-CoA-carboxylase] ligase [Sphingomonadaceae bacterium]